MSEDSIFGQRNNRKLRAVIYYIRIYVIIMVFSLFFSRIPFRIIEIS